MQEMVSILREKKTAIYRDKYSILFKLNLALIELRRVEAAEDIAYQLSQSPNVVYVNDGSNMLLNLAGMK